MPAENRTSRPAAPLHLPTYLLYAEEGGMAPPDVLHWESIAQRSALHGWEIRPHRHESLLQVLLLDRGRAEALLDGRRHALRGPAVITVMPLAAHGFKWSPRVQGSVLTLQAAHVRQLLAHEPALRDAVLQTRCGALVPAHHAALQQAMNAVRDEHGHIAPWRATAIDAALIRLLVTVCRALPPPAEDAPAAGSRALAHVRRFRELVELRFREQPTVAALAAELGITPTQLNRVCRQVLGHPALAVLQARICLEAQRELAYTTLSVKQIAFDLGFADAGYFTRFFQRETGQAPSAWRRAAAA
jgi:AraC family transcriptional regulator, transcriptional activator of pobA